jgi:hypothetical protein
MKTNNEADMAQALSGAVLTAVVHGNIHVWKGGIRVNVYNRKFLPIDTYADDKFRDNISAVRKAIKKLSRD